MITEYEENGHGEPIVSAPRKVVDSVVPGRGGFLPGTRVAMVSAGSSHTACITAAGELFSWGSSEEGQLGHGGEPAVSMLWNRSILYRLRLTYVTPVLVKRS